MNGQIEGFIAPCLWGNKLNQNAYLLYNEGDDDVLIQLHHLPKSIISKGGRVRLSGEILFNGGVKEMSVESYILID